MSPTAGGIVTSLQVQRRFYLLRQIPNDDDTNHHKSTLVPLVRPDGQPINYHVFPLSILFCVTSSLPLVPCFLFPIFLYHHHVFPDARSTPRSKASDRIPCPCGWMDCRWGELGEMDERSTVAGWIFHTHQPIRLWVNSGSKKMVP